jgi:DNA modification methylase
MRQMMADGVRVQMACTSPPYWGLRDYGTATWEGGDPTCDHFMPPLVGTAKSTLSLSVDADGFSTGKTQPNKAQYRAVCAVCGARRIDSQLGLEATPEEYVANMVEVFSLARDLLADDGVLFLNLGDSYMGGGRGGGAENCKQQTNVGSLDAAPNQRHATIKTKDLVGIPWRVAFALQADGWYLRQDIIWAKPNPMPESVTDRCTKSHEYLFLLAKSARYYYDAAAIAEPLAYASVERLTQPNLENQVGSDRVPGKTNGNMKAVSRESWNGSSFDKGKTGEMKHTRGYTKPYDGQSTKDYAAGGAQDASATKARIVDGILSGEITTRNKRSVWTVTTKPFSSRLLRGASGGSDRIVSPDCPIHAVSGYLASKAVSDAQRVASQSAHNPRNDDHPELWPQDERVPTDPLHGEDSFLKNSDSPARAYSETAILHNSGSHKTARVPSTSQHVKPDVESPPRTDGNERSHGSNANDDHTPENSTALDYGAGARVSDRAEQSRNRNVCTCAYEDSIDHFAVFPPDLIEPCILAGSRPGDTVLDPFFGSGTTGEVAQALGRQWIGCELNRDYETLQKKRTEQLGMVLA